MPWIAALSPLVTELIARGADVNRTVQGFSALSLAISGRRTAMVNLLAAHGATGNGSGLDGAPLLAAVIKAGDLDLAARLLANGADVSPRDQRNSETALHAAVSRGDVALVKAIVSRGANLEALDADQSTAPHPRGCHARTRGDQPVPHSVLAPASACPAPAK